LSTVTLMPSVLVAGTLKGVEEEQLRVSFSTDHHQATHTTF